jgi:hypothetical protein
MALTAVAEAQAAAGQSREARKTIDAVQGAGERAHALYHLALGQARGGDLKAARKTFQEAADLILAADEQDRHLHYHNLASAQGLAGDVAGALHTVKEFLKDQPIALVNVAYAQAQAGDVKGALLTGSRLRGSDEWWHGNLLRGIAKVQAERGGARAALAWATAELPSPFERANALLGVAEGLAARAEGR